MLIERRDPTSLVLRVSIPQKIALPSSWIDSTSSESGELWTKERSQQATLNPCDARNRAVASPKPEEAPVTSATLAMRCIEKNTRSTWIDKKQRNEITHGHTCSGLRICSAPFCSPNTPSSTCWRPSPFAARSWRSQIPQRPSAPR